MLWTKASLHGYSSFGNIRSDSGQRAEIVEDIVITKIRMKRP